VREFQRPRALPVDGIAGAMTLISVNNALGLAGRPGCGRRLTCR
jgi:hypothetical protein